MAYKFDDCSMCRFRKRPAICRDCDYGEQFEDAEVAELRFDDDSFIRAERTLTTDDDEPNFNPNDLFDRIRDDDDDDEDEDNEDDE